MVPKISNHVGCLKFLAQAVPKKCQQEEEGRPEASRFRTSKLSDPTTDRPGLRDLSGKVQDLTPEPCLARPQSSRGGLLGVRQSVATAQPWHQQHIYAREPGKEIGPLVALWDGQRCPRETEPSLGYWGRRVGLT